MTGDAWTHPVCDNCWTLWRPGQTPTRLLMPRTELCCACGLETMSGIYFRADPYTMPCKGQHRSGAA